MKPLDRFLMLEAARPAVPDRDDPLAAHDNAVSQRFAAVGAAPVPEAAPVVAPAAHDPFAPPPDHEAGYELEPRDARPTVRCVDCAFENSRSAHDVCARCGAPLDSRAARHLNLQLDQDERAAVFVANQAAAERAAREAAQAEPVAEPAQIESALPVFDRLVDRIARGRAARWPMPARRALVIAAAGALLGTMFLLTHSALIGFVLALVVTVGICLLPT